MTHGTYKAVQHISMGKFVDIKSCPSSCINTKFLSDQQLKIHRALVLSLIFILCPMLLTLQEFAILFEKSLPEFLVQHMNIIVAIAPLHKISLIAMKRAYPNTSVSQKYPTKIKMKIVETAVEFIINFHICKKNHSNSLKVGKLF